MLLEGLLDGWINGRIARSLSASWKERQDGWMGGERLVETKCTDECWVHGQQDAIG